ncbi:hypothetical protein AAFO90_16925 [Phaeobacter sp. CAU 1743]|uniref:hypothetical protein n=1 Tax=Phaeobacter sp. CAU 1743 TaxID=3140367 RepID=UPI00325C1053
MNATAAAMKAKSGSFGLRDQLDLARSALVHAETIPFCCSEVEFFLATVNGSPAAAANRLLAFAQALVPQKLQEQPEFDWQKRADLQ